MLKRRLMVMALTLPLAVGVEIGAIGIGNVSHAQTDDLVPFGSLEPPRLPDLKNGERLFKKCQQCHTTRFGEKKIGPSLAGVLGRRPGSVEDFGYSEDMIAFGATGNLWNRETLDLFLTRPRDLIARTKMAFPGFKKESDRADLIEYISQF